MTDNPIPLFGSPIGPWHWHFAWRPIRTYDQRLFWLRWVERRCIQRHSYLSGGGPDFWWQYRAMIDHEIKLAEGGPNE